MERGRVSRRGKWTSSDGHQALYLEKFPWKRGMIPGQVPMDRRRGTVPTWTSSHGQEAWYSTYLDKFPWTGGVVRTYLHKFPWTGGVVQYLPGQVPMDRRRGTEPTLTSSHGQEAWCSTYLDKFPWTEGVVQYLP